MEQSSAIFIQSHFRGYITRLKTLSVKLRKEFLRIMEIQHKLNKKNIKLYLSNEVPERQWCD